jgi:putative DNA primase/helicase
MTSSATPSLSPWLEEKAAEISARGGSRGAASLVKGSTREETHDGVGALVLDSADPLNTAREFLRQQYTADAQLTLRFWHDTFYQWTGSAYEEISTADLRARLYQFLDLAKVAQDAGLAPFRPTRRKVGDVLDALQALANVPSALAAPSWLIPDSLPKPDELISCANGLLHLPREVLLPASPSLFTFNSVPIPFRSDTPLPDTWLRFLGSVWPDDSQAVATLQEIFGYLLTTDTRQQKVFMLVGPPRSGKGTIAEILKHLLGSRSVAGPTLASLSQNFGLASLIGKQLAIISDARLGARSDHQVIAERLLSISGQDMLSVPQKFLPDYTGNLSTRFLILTNELPKLTDASGALASRFLIITMRRSFLGREDTNLRSALLPELPGIFRWAVDGWRRLHERGHFLTPASSTEAAQELDEIASPIRTFLRENCETGPGFEVERGMIFNAWACWCKERGRDPGSIESFARDLRAAVPTISSSQPRRDGRRVRTYLGIKLS